MELLIAAVLVAAVAAFVLAPFRAQDSGSAGTATEDPVLAALEARKEAKYREIRDTEMDRAQGKLTEAEFKIQDAELRAEAIEILKLIDAHGSESAPEEGPEHSGGAEGQTSR